MHKLQLGLGIPFPHTFIFAGDIIAIIFPCRKALKPHLGSASRCVRHCSSGLPAPASLKAKGSSQTEGGKGKRGLGEVGQLRSPSPLPPHPQHGAQHQLHCSVKPSTALCRCTAPPGSKPSCRGVYSTQKPLTTRFLQIPGGISW